MVTESTESSRKIEEKTGTCMFIGGNEITATSMSTINVNGRS